MSVSPSLTLPWTVADADEKRFRRIVVITLVITLIIGAIVPLLPVIKKPVVREAELPPRIAKLIIEKREIQKPRPVVKPKPKPEPKPVVKKEPVPIKKPAEKPRVVAKPKPVKPKVDTTKLAREKASKSGLLALSDSLADLRDQSTVKQLKGTTRLSNNGSRATQTERSLITSKVSSTSKGINTAGLTRDAGSTHLVDRTATEVQKPVFSDGSDVALPNVSTGITIRSDEEIQLVFDRNKSTIYSLYNRELRRNPSLQGKMVIRLTISPAGTVTHIELISSELGLPSLEDKLIKRIRLFKFGAKATESVTITYPIQFLPA